MMFLENALININTFLYQNEIKKLEKAYDIAYANSVEYRNKIYNQFDMNYHEKIKYSNLMYIVDNAKISLLEYTRKHNVKSDILYISQVYGFV